MRWDDARRSIGRAWRGPWLAATGLLLGGLLAMTLVPVQPTGAALQVGGGRGQLLIGRDDDNRNNPLIQPAGAAADQSLANADLLLGTYGNDVMIGLLGSDVMEGGPGRDIQIGGTEQASAPNSDLMSGGDGDDVNIWAPGDGSELFIGGAGVDAIVFGVIDRATRADGKVVPTLTGQFPGFADGVPTANVSGQGGFCRIERVEDPALGYQYLVRFFVRSSGALAVTVRLVDVEQVYCTSEAGGEVVFANLTAGETDFRVVSLEQVEQLNGLVRAIIR